MSEQEIRNQWPHPDVAANIFRLDEALASPPDLNRLVAVAGIAPPPAEAWEELGPLLQFEQAPHEFTVYRPSHAIRYVDVSRWQIDDGVSTLALDDREAIGAAMAIVEQFALFGNAHFVPTKVTRLNVARTNKENPLINHRIIDAGIVFARNIDGLSSEGPGGKVVVYLDPAARLSGFERVARSITGVHASVEGWRGPDEVLDEIQHYWNRPFGDDFTPEEVRIGYLELGRLQPQTLMQPVYVLTLLFRHQENGANRTVEHFVHAARNGIGPLMPRRDIVLAPPTRHQ